MRKTFFKGKRQDFYVSREEANEENMIQFLSSLPGGMRAHTKYIIMHNKFGISTEECNALSDKLVRRLERSFK